MKKIKLSLITAGLMLLPLTALAFSAPTEPGSGISSVGGITTTIVDQVWVVFAGLAVIMFVWAGVTFLLANGNPEKIAQARQAALWGVIGVVVMIIAFSIFNIAGSLVTGSGS